MNEAEALRHLTIQVEQIQRTLGRMVNFGSSYAKRLIERKQLLEQEIANYERLREARHASTAGAVPKQLELAVQPTPTKDQKPSSSGQVPKRGRRRKRKLTNREKDILEVLKADKERRLHGPVYCATLELKKIPPSPEMITEGCPTTYPEAYKIVKWKPRIQDEKYRLSQFLPKKRTRLSPRTS